MPNRKEIEIIRRIQDAGYLREFDQTPQLNLPKLKIENNPHQSSVFAYCGGMGVILDLRITSDRPVPIQYFGDLQLLGRPCNVDWWESEKDVYNFDQGPQFPRDVVLNHCVGVLVEPRRPLDGFLLGRSATRVPSMYSHGFRLSLNLSIMDGFDTRHTAELLAQVDEHLCSKIRQPIQGSLYAPRQGSKRDLVDRAEDCAPEEQQHEIVHGRPVS